MRDFTHARMQYNNMSIPSCGQILAAHITVPFALWQANEVPHIQDVSVLSTSVVLQCHVCPEGFEISEEKKTLNLGRLSAFADP